MFYHGLAVMTSTIQILTRTILIEGNSTDVMILDLVATWSFDTITYDHYYSLLKCKP